MIISYPDPTNPAITGLRLAWNAEPAGNSIVRHAALDGLVAAMSPFGSLTSACSDLKTLANLVLDAVDRDVPETATALITALHSTDQDVCGVAFKGSSVILFTPTSGTEIRVSRSSSVTYEVTVDFGAVRPARSRDEQISQATPDYLRWRDIHDDGHVPSADVAMALLRYAYEIAILSKAFDPTLEPAPGWVARAVDRAIAEGVLPPHAPTEGRWVGDEGETRCGDWLRAGARRLCGPCAQPGVDDDTGCGDLLERSHDSVCRGCSS